ncbi:MAG: hypothetical protein R3C13_00205 [Hyphomonas sp.]|uniref:hypothetical protein n=1 Tax=Hyphomonas sp. TaxID=87 RepID=UPI00352890C5
MSDYRSLAIRVLRNADSNQKEALRVWSEQLLALQRSDLEVLTKAKEALKLTAGSKVVIPVLKIIAKELKLDKFDVSKIRLSSSKDILNSIRSFWRDRSLAAKLGLGASTVALAIFGTKGAGIAALGTAIGVPLWVVFGAGATFIGVLYEEITGKKPDVTTTYTVIDAKDKGGAGIAGRISRAIKSIRPQ